MSSGTHWHKHTHTHIQASTHAYVHTTAHKRLSILDTGCWGMRKGQREWPEGNTLPTAEQDYQHSPSLPVSSHSLQAGEETPQQLRLASSRNCKATYHRLSETPQYMTKKQGAPVSSPHSLGHPTIVR